MIKVILFQPEMPSNVGNIMRTCAASNLELHIIGPVSFLKNDSLLKRASLDYKNMLEIIYYADYADFINKNPNRSVFLITRFGFKTYSETDFKSLNQDIYLMFGNESKGIPLEIMHEYPHERWLRIPMLPFARSLNLANTVALVSYEVLRQKDFPSLALEEVVKGDHKKT